MDWNTMYGDGGEGQEDISMAGVNEDPISEVALGGLTEEAIAALKNLDENELGKYLPPEIRRELEAVDNPTESSGKNEDTMSNGTFQVHNSLTLNPTPTKEDLVRIMESYHNGGKEERDEAQKEMLGILESYLLNIIMTRYYSYTRKHMGDLLQQGYLAIITGMKTYDPELGAPTTWFSRYIHHELQNYINTQVNHTTQHYSTATRKVMECIERKKKQNKPCTKKDIYLETGVPLKTIAKCLQLQEMTSVSLSSEESPADLSSDFIDPEEYVSNKIEQEHIADIVFGSRDGKYISTLTEQEKDVIALRYGFDGRGARSFAEIEKITGIPRHKLGKLLASALKKIKFELTKEKYGVGGKDISAKTKKREFLLDNFLSDAEVEETQNSLTEYFKQGLLE